MRYQSKMQLILLATACWLGAAGSALADAAPMTEDAYEAAEERIEVQARAERKACRELKGHARDVCETQAKGREKVAKAELAAQREPTPDAIQEAKEARAEAERELAEERCEAFKDKDKRRKLCLQKARHAYDAAIRLAKVEKVDSIRKAEREAKKRAETAAASPS